MSDRRSGNERRTTNRYPVEVTVEWEAAAGRQPGTMSDVSFDGCFVLSNGDVADGRNVKLDCLVVIAQRIIWLVSLKISKASVIERSAIYRSKTDRFSEIGERAIEI